jgi:hypothetical protein
MNRIITGAILSILLSSVALADEPAIGFWVVGVKELQKAVDEYGSLDKMDDTEMSTIAECSGRFGGRDCHFHLQSDAFSFSIAAQDDGAQLEYRATLGGGKVKRAARNFDGVVKVGPTWSLPDEWKSRKHLIVFKRLNLKS